MKAQNRKEIFLKALANGEEPKIKPLTREEALLKEQAKRESESSSGGASGCDWNTMKNKPFGEEVKEVVVIEEQEFTATDWESNGCDLVMLYDDVPKEDIILEAGKTYNVTFNGESYECVAESQEVSDGTTIYIGNGYRIDDGGSYENNGLPFTVVCQPSSAGDYWIKLLTEDKSTYTQTHKTNTLSITTVGTEITPLDEKYIQLTSPNGTKYSLSVADDGTLSATVI